MTKKASDYLRDFPFFAHLTADEKEYAANHTSVRKVCKGEILYGGDAPCIGLSLILSGKLRVYLVSEEGREITVYTLKKGDSCVLSASCVISRISLETVITAEEDSELLVLSSEVFFGLTESNIYAKEFMYELAAERLSRIIRVMEEILFSGFDRRLARFLLSEYERTGETDLKMTQEEIARNVNSAREVVARMLKRFSGEGLIEVRHGSIVLLKPDRLKKLL